MAKRASSRTGRTRNQNAAAPTPRIAATPSSRRNFFGDHPVLLFAAIAACWVLLLYGRALTAPFVYDDLTAIRDNPSLASWHSILQYFRHAVPLNNQFRGGSAGSIYRPLVWLGYLIESKTWGLYPPGFHLTNLVLHWANGVFGFLLLRKLRTPVLLSALSCLLWLALPINSEAVAWISGRHTCQAAAFVVLSLLIAVSYLGNPRAWLIAAYLAASLAALLSNEWGGLFLPLTGLILYAAGGWPNRSNARLWLAIGGSGLASLSFVLLLRHMAGAGLPLRSLTLLPVGLTVLQYVGWMLLPVRMSIERSSDTPPASLTAVALLSFLLVLAALSAILLLRRRFPRVSAGLAWTAIALFPFCGLFFIYQGMAERYTYLASGGLAFAAAASVFRLSAGSRRSLGLSAIGVWAIWGVWRLESRLADWQTAKQLYQSSLEATPGSAVLLYDLAEEFSRDGEIDAAIQCYGRALALNPAYGSALINLGNALGAEGRYAEALNSYGKAALLDRNNPEPWINLGNVQLQTGQLAEAKAAYRHALLLQPSNGEALLNLGAALQSSGDAVGARRQYEQAIAFHPDDAAAYCDLGTLLFAQGDLKRARAQFELAIRHGPGYPAAYFDLGVLDQKQGDNASAAAMYRKALLINPGYEKARRNLASLR